MLLSATASGSPSKLRTIAERAHKRPPPWPVLAFDPGNTTGWCLFDQYVLKGCGQIEGKASQLRALVHQTRPRVVVSEDYVVYAHKLQQHAGSRVDTLRLIGALELVCADYDIHHVQQLAATAKGFCTNDKLHEWGLWQIGKQHANDAIRHAVWYILFGKH